LDKLPLSKVFISKSSLHKVTPFQGFYVKFILGQGRLFPRFSFQNHHDLHWVPS
jgi:hypothetical protein